MNFLSHYYLDRDDERPYFTAGAATPDLLSIFHPGARIRSSRMAHIPLPEPLGDFEAFLQGLDRHFVADGVFHESPLFRQETQWITREISKRFAIHRPQRKFFIAHILLELMLDKVLINKHPGLIESFYRHFELMAPFEELAAFTEVALGRELPSYVHFLEKFEGNRYLYRYRDFSHISFVLGRILRRVRIPDSEWLNSTAFLGLMEEYETRLGEIYPSFFQEIEAHPKG